MTDQLRTTPPVRAAVDRRTYLAAVGAAGLAGLGGCLGGDGGGGDATGRLATHVTDQPGDISDFESCVVTLAGIWVKPADDDGGTADGDDARTYHEFDEPQEADLVALQDGKTKLVDERELPAREYEFLQLDVTAVDATLDSGEKATVDTPGDAPLKFDQSFEIREGQTTTFTADFTPVRRGRTNEYVLQPVADGTTVEYGS